MVTGIAPYAGFPSKQNKRRGRVSDKLVPSRKLLLDQTNLYRAISKTISVALYKNYTIYWKYVH